MTALQTPPGESHESSFSLKKWMGNILDFWQILRSRMADDRITQRAAALTYNTLFSLLPTLVLALVIMSLVLSGKQIQQEETQLISRLGLNQMQGARQFHAAIAVCQHNHQSDSDHAFGTEKPNDGHCRLSDPAVGSHQSDAGH